MEKLSELPVWYKWKRPASSVPYPNTWHRFTTTTKDGEVYRMKIVDLIPERFEESMEFTKNYFYPTEPLTVSSKFLEDEISFHNNQCKHRALLQQRISIIGVLDEDAPKPEIVGMLKLLVTSKQDNQTQNMLGDALQKKHELFKELEKNHDPFEVFNADKVIREYGLCVKPKYRGLNIGYNLLLTVEKLAKAFNVETSVIVCSSVWSQNIAEKLGYKTLNAIVYDEYKDDQGRVIFPVEGTKSIKLMAIEYL